MNVPSRPSFARDFPATPELDALVEEFRAGHYSRVRQGAPRLAAESSDERVRSAARLLLARTRPDPLAVAMLALTAALLLVLSAWWVVHGRPPPGESQRSLPTQGPSRTADTKR
jgi:hypothetical protein